MHQTQFFPAALFLGLLLGGCARVAPVPPGDPEVLVSEPVVKEITDFEDFTGRIQAAHFVEIRARVGGYLVRGLKEPDGVNKEGTEVKQGELLFEIDPSTYDADLNRAQAGLHQAEARVKRLLLDYNRAVPLLPSGAISREDFDKIAGDRDEGAASVKQAEAAVKLAQINMGFTKVVAPFAGRVGQQLIDPGNMVKADETVLTTIVSLDPVYAYFDVDERTMLRVRRLIRSGEMKSAREAKLAVQVGVADDLDKNGNPLFPYTGVINFVDNRVDALSGTLRLRCELPDPKRMFSAGMFVRVRIPIGKPHRAILVGEPALRPDQGEFFVYVVNADNEVAYRRVKVGALHDGLRAVNEETLKAGERVVVSGLQRIRPDTKTVIPTLVAMPLHGIAPAPPPRASASKNADRRPAS